MIDQKVKKVLLIDDDVDDQSFFRSALSELSEETELLLACDGNEGLEILQNTINNLPELIFLDLRMPRFNGKDCLLKIKADNRLKDIPVIIYTTSKDVEESEHLQHLGAVHFVTKPCDPEEICYVLSVVLNEDWGNKVFH